MQFPESTNNQLFPDPCSWDKGEFGWLLWPSQPVRAAIVTDSQTHDVVTEWRGAATTHQEKLLWEHRKLCSSNAQVHPRALSRRNSLKDTWGCFCVSMLQRFQMHFWCHSSFFGSCSRWDGLQVRTLSSGFYAPSESGCNCLAKSVPENSSSALCIFTKCSVHEASNACEKITLSTNSGVAQNDEL